MKQWTIEVEGKTVKGYSCLVEGRLWVHSQGETYVLETSELNPARPRRGGSSRASNAAGAHPGAIISPMPGKITKIQVELGQNVNLHQVLVIMEAMKMEYTLKSPSDGVVKAVNCELGQQVALGDVLVELEL